MRHRAILLIILAGLLSACGGAAQPTPTPTPTPREISAQVGQATQAAESVHFAISLAGTGLRRLGGRLCAQQHGG